jgi:hypothetical protein
MRQTHPARKELGHFLGGIAAVGEYGLQSSGGGVTDEERGV